MAYGKKNKINTDPLYYNICLLGQSKCGKTTLIKEVCEKLAGEDGYLFLECGSERGADAINNIVYVNCPEWNMEYDELTNSIGFADICNDIIENKTTEYPNLRTVVIDTYDHLIQISETEAIRLWNKECREKGKPEKMAKTINESWSGFARGEKKALELMFNMISELRKVGVSTIVIGHCKNREVTDIFTGETYQTLTSDQMSTYFNELKKNLHFLGLAYIDRTIVKEKTNKKNPMTGQAISINKITSEARRIKFRDDSYAVDSGCRFADIVPEIEMNADAFIKALTDAIESERSKSGMTLEESKKEEERVREAEQERIAKAEEQRKAESKLTEMKSEITQFFSSNKGNIDLIKPVLTQIREYGYSNPTEIDNVEKADAILELIAKASTEVKK